MGERLRMPKINANRIIEKLRMYQREIEVYEMMLKRRVELNETRAEIPVYGRAGSTKGTEIGVTLSQKREYRLDTYMIQRHILDVQKEIKEQKAKYNLAHYNWVKWCSTKVELEVAANELQREFESCLQLVYDLKLVLTTCEEIHKLQIEQQLDIAKEELTEAQNRAVKAQKKLTYHSTKKPQQLEPLESRLVVKEEKTISQMLSEVNASSTSAQILTAAEIRRKDKEERKIEKIIEKKSEEDLVIESAGIRAEDMVIPDHIDTSNMSAEDILIIKNQLLDERKSKIAREIIKLNEGNLII